MDTTPSSLSPAPPPFDGDPTWRAVRRLGGGSGAPTEITIRGIVPEDREELRRAFHETSARTRYFRFLSLVGELSDAALTHLTCVDQKDHVALVATVASPDLKTERGVGVARFIRLEESPDVAEAAITVVDSMQRRGIGKALSYELERAARVRGIRVLRAEVLADNAAMRAILEHAGARQVDDGIDGGTLRYDVALPEEPVSPQLIDILRGAAQTMAMTIGRLRVR